MVEVSLAEGGLNALLRRINEARRAGTPLSDEDALNRVFEFDERLALYGSRTKVATGNPFIDQMSSKLGIGTLRGRAQGTLPWGGMMNIPALIWDPSGEEVAVSVATHTGLTSSWTTFDALMGKGFTRVVAPCKLTDGTLVVATLYEPR